MTHVTVACVFVRGHVPFTPEYVVRLHSMATRLLPDHRFVCLTDQPNSLPSFIESIPAKPPKSAFAWWTKVQLFNPSLFCDGRVIYFDLDVLLLGGLQELLDYPAPLAFAPDGAPNFKPKDRALKVVKRFNSSVIVWDAGKHAELYERWGASVTKRLWGDQDWFGEQQPKAAAMPLEWFPRLSACGPPPWPSSAKVLLCKKPKNLDAAAKWNWFNEAWQ